MKSATFLYGMLLASAAFGMQLTLDGTPKATIVVSTTAIPSETTAANEFQAAVSAISGATLPIHVLGSGELPAGALVFIGDSVASTEIIPKSDLESLGEEEFILRTEGSRFVIAGGRPRGTLYGVYHFLEYTLGVRYLTSTVSHFPKQPTLVVPELAERHKPAFAFRNALYFDLRDNPLASARFRVNGYYHATNEHTGGGFPWAQPPHHTMNWLLTQDKALWEADPNTVGMYDGKRVPIDPCFSNEKSATLMAARVRQWMRDSPTMRYFSVTQFDGPYACQCPDCAKLNERWGSPQGSHLTFVNRVAELCEEEFPQNRVVTFAYSWSQEPPKNGLKPRKNVVIQFCLFMDAGTNYRQLREWDRLCDPGQLMVWDYYTGFSHWTVPFPIQWRFQPDTRFFREMGVSGVLAQSNYQCPGSSFAELNAYLVTHLLWNPDWDFEKGIEEFMTLYYGSAAPQMREYLELINEGQKKLNAYGTADDWTAPAKLITDATWGPVFEKGFWLTPYYQIYLNPTKMTRYVELFDSAERQAASDPELLRRVKLARMQIQLIQIHTLPADDPTRTAIITDYFNTAAAHGVWRFGEFTAMDEFKGKILPKAQP